MNFIFGGEFMDFLSIEAFWAIVKTRSLSKAAELLHLSQSAVSHRLKVLERDMGVTLIERHKGIQTTNLTPFGESFVGLAERWTTLNREMNILRVNGPHMGLAIGLVRNGLEAMLNGGTITIRTRREDNRIMLVIQDQDPAYQLMLGTN
jgi:signal transduction histidine kinase